MLVYVLFYLGQLSHFPSCCDAGVTNLNEPPSSFLLPPDYCGLGAGSIPFRAIVNDKQCEMRGLFMSLVIHYWIADIQDCQGVSASEMTYIVSSGALNSTHSLTSLKLLSRHNRWAITILLQSLRTVTAIRGPYSVVWFGNLSTEMWRWMPFCKDCCGVQYGNLGT